MPARIANFRITRLLVRGALLAFWPLLAVANDGTLTFKAIDEDSRQPLAVRMEVRDARGRPVRLRPQDAVVADGSIYFDGELSLDLRHGDYSFLIEAGPEFVTRPGKFTIERGSQDMEEVTLKRHVDMAEEGWRAGDLDVQSPLADLALMMRARRVDYAPVAVVVNDAGRCVKRKNSPGTATSEAAPPFYGPWASLDQRRGGGLLAIGGEPPIDVCQWKRDDPTLPVADAARQTGARIVALTPFAWDLPVWVAAGKLDAVLVINRSTQPNGTAESVNDGRPRDTLRFPGKLGVGRYSEAIYHHLLNCGLRIPPAAGSGAGSGDKARVVRGPLGVNRVYVHCGDAFTPEAWLDGLRNGRVVVTNGPLLRTRVEGEPPGHVFTLEPGERRQFQIALDLAFYEQAQVEYLEILKDGKSVHQVRLAELAEQAGRLPPITFDASGWFLIRAVTNNAETYQFASTGAYFVEVEGQPRVSRSSAQFFIDWLDEASRKFAGNAPVAAEFDAARPFWKELLEVANAE